MTSGAPTPERKPRNKPPRKQNSNVVEGDELLQSIAAKSSVLLHPQVTLTCYIPTNSVGAVIGRRGSTILQIQKQAQQASTTGGSVRVSIVGHEDREAQQSDAPEQQQNTPPSAPYTYSELDWTCPHWTPVVIRADPCAALAAASQLNKIVEGELDDVVLDLPLSRLKHAALVGKRGVVLANLSADTGVRIMVPPKNLRHDVIQLEGELSKVKMCLERVLTLASESNNRTKKGPSNNNNNAREETAEASLQETVTVAILPPQTKLRQIARKTDTVIKKKRQDDEWTLTVIGSSSENIQSALALVEKWTEESAESPRPRRGRKPPGRKKGGGRGGGGGGGANNTATSAPAATTAAAEPSSS